MNGVEEGVEFLPVNNAKKVEKRGPRRWVVLVVVLVTFLLLSLMAGLLVWHFHCEYSGVCGRWQNGGFPLLSMDRPYGGQGENGGRDEGMGGEELVGRDQCTVLLSRFGP